MCPFLSMMFTASALPNGLYSLALTEPRCALSRPFGDDPLRKGEPHLSPGGSRSRVPFSPGRYADA
jgi:hypothetical protein